MCVQLVIKRTLCGLFYLQDLLLLFQFAYQSLQVVEDFKESDPHCLACGYLLASNWPAPEMKHFGLQLIEHYIR